MIVKTYLTIRFIRDCDKLAHVQGGKPRDNYRAGDVATFLDFICEALVRAGYAEIVAGNSADCAENAR